MFSVCGLGASRLHAASGVAGTLAVYLPEPFLHAVVDIVDPSIQFAPRRICFYCFALI
jgi:hypothetical protein